MELTLAKVLAVSLVYTSIEFCFKKNAWKKLFFVFFPKKEEKNEKKDMTLNYSYFMLLDKSFTVQLSLILVLISRLRLK